MEVTLTDRDDDQLLTVEIGNELFQFAFSSWQELMEGMEFAIEDDKLTERSARAICYYLGSIRCEKAISKSKSLNG